MRGRKAKSGHQLKVKVDEEIKPAVNSVEKQEKQIQTPFFKVLDDFEEKSKEIKSFQKLKKEKEEQKEEQKEPLKDMKEVLIEAEKNESEKKIYEILFTPEKKKRFKQSDEKCDETQKYKISSSKISSSKRSQENSSQEPFMIQDEENFERILKKSDEDQFNMSYYNILKIIENDEQFEMPELCFDQNQQKQGYTAQLFLFKPNFKNGRHLRFDNTLKTCIPIFRCQGCFKEFKIASALGGHLSKCPNKRVHEKVINQRRQSRYLNKLSMSFQNQNQSDENLEQKGDILKKWDSFYSKQFKFENYLNKFDEADYLMKIQPNQFLLEKKGRISGQNQSDMKIQKKNKRIKKKLKDLPKIMSDDQKAEEMQEQE